MTPQERYCTLCAAAVILAFVALALYLDPKGLSQLNPFSGEDCSAQADYNTCQLAQYTHQLAWFTAALALATILLIVIGIIQARQLSRHAAHTENLVSTARETAERQLRAYLQVTPENLNSIVWLNTSQIPVSRLLVKNTGQTPAYEVEIDVAISPGTFPSPKTLPDFETRDEPYRLVIHPGQAHHLGYTRDRHLTQNEVDQLIPGTDLRLYLYGEVRYRDAFKKDRYTRFRMMTEKDVQGGQSLFVFCDQGNEAT